MGGCKNNCLTSFVSFIKDIFRKCYKTSDDEDNDNSVVIDLEPITMDIRRSDNIVNRDNDIVVNRNDDSNSESDDVIVNRNNNDEIDDNDEIESNEGSSDEIEENNNEVNNKEIVIELNEDLTIHNVYVRYNKYNKFVAVPLYKDDNPEYLQNILDTYFFIQNNDDEWCYVADNDVFIYLNKFYTKIKKNPIPINVLGNIYRIRFNQKIGVIPCGYQTKQFANKLEKFQNKTKK